MHSTVRAFVAVLSQRSRSEFGVPPPVRRCGGTTAASLATSPDRQCWAMTLVVPQPVSVGRRHRCAVRRCPQRETPLSRCQVGTRSCDMPPPEGNRQRHRSHVRRSPGRVRSAATRADTLSACGPTRNWPTRAMSLAVLHNPPLALGYPRGSSSRSASSSPPMGRHTNSPISSAIVRPVTRSQIQAATSVVGDT